MNSTTQLASHELLELHEIIRSEVIAARKIQVSMALVTDQDFKSFMERSLQIKKNILDKYQDFYNGQTTH